MNLKHRLQRIDSALSEFSLGTPRDKYEDEIRAADRRLAKNSYQGRGTLVGAVTGAAGGAAVARRFFHGNQTGRTLRNRMVAGGLLGAYFGGAIGRNVGENTEKKKAK